MQEVSTRAPRPTTPEDLHRLAALAEQRGLRLSEERPGVWFCSSASSDRAHAVTGLSCDCRGFIEHQRCSHDALLLDHLGWLPEVEPEDAEPPALAPLPCGNCSGGGVVSVKDCDRAGWPHPDCPDCEGTGEIPTAA